MRQTFRQSIAGKMMLVVLSTTLAALLVTGVTLVIYDARAYRDLWIQDLTTQADILARASAPALAFNDPKSAHENLALLRVRPAILAGAIYTPDGAVFAEYRQSGLEDDTQIPARPPPPGHEIAGDQLVLAARIVDNSIVLGTVYLRGRFALTDRLVNYVSILTAVTLLSLAFAALLATWLQRSVTLPIHEVTAAARNVIEHRDFSQQVKRTTDDELGVLVDAFNTMLTEVGRRASALEESNRILQHEMTERRGAEDALRRADRRKDEFLATLAHELRNPLAPLRTGLELLRIASDNPAKAGAIRDMMQRQMNQMVRLVDDLLDVSRITRGRLTINRELVDLQTVLDDSIETARPLIESKQHRLETELSGARVTLDADPTRLAQVFSNLLNNAARYTPAGGTISLRAVHALDEVMVSVSDTGIGLSAAELAAVFGMFVQVDRSLERINAGLGVGLSLARHLVELHGGDIEARSAGLGCGSEFVVRLPVNAQAPAALAAPRRISPPAPPRRVLLADDNVDFAAGLAAILRERGHEVTLLNDGASALAAATQNAPEFAFLDIGLPGLNGYDLARRLREQPQTACTVLTAVTGWGQQSDRELAKQAGFDCHLVKPVDFEQVDQILAGDPPVHAKL
ncbi:MAG: hybrid sensor histidine kinase/response regulator [Steroidobacter sp.]